MSEKTPVGQPSHQEPKLDHYPPPPPGPPPSQAAAHHSNETPIPDYNIPSYNPTYPQFAPPPESEGLYDEEAIPSAKPQEHTADHTATAAAAKPSWGERFSAWGVKAAAPVNMLANKMGSETFLPTTMDKECEKAARILRSFCKDGIYTDAEHQPAPAAAPSVTPAEGVEVAADGKAAATVAKPKPKSRTLLTIPSKVISRAVGLAIFTTGRLGFHVTGATGSGILIARLSDGRWSPPSGIQVHSLGAGFVIGVDIYDCVVVINTKEALEAFTRTRMSLGSDLAVTAGPWGAGGSLDFAAPASDKEKKNRKAKEDEVETKTEGLPHPSDQDAKAVEAQHQGLGGGPAPAALPEVTTGVDTTTSATQSTPGDLKAGTSTSKDRKPSPLRQAISKPVYSYVKSRGFYAGVQIDGTVITERKDANAAFYGGKVPVEKILKGEVPTGIWETYAKALFDVVKGAEGWRAQGQSTTGSGMGAGTLHVPAVGSYVATPSVGVHAGSSGGPGVVAATAGLQQMHLGTAPAAGGAAPMTKAQEAAAESSSAQPQSPTAAPPAYLEPTGSEDPPAYVDDGQVHTGTGDTKTTH